MNRRILIIGPVHPDAIGGIATIMRTLQQEFSGEKGILFIDTTKPTGFVKMLVHPIFLMLTIFRKSIKASGGSALMFSSAYASFWEKCVWCVICKTAGVFTVMQMVDGNFPTFHEKLPKPIKWIASQLIKCVGVLAVQSDQWRVFYEGIFPHTKVKIVSPGIDTDFFTPSTMLMANNPPKLIYMGWLIEAKGVYDLLHAVHIIKKKGLSLKLQLIGPDYGNKERILNVVQSLEIEEMVDVSDPVTSREIVLQIYQSADAFVFPSHFEGFPYALMEAISCGLPCIATRVGGVPDILDNGQCGLLIEKKSPPQLAERMEMIIGNEDYRRTLGNRARARAVREYSLSKSFNDFKDVLYYDHKGL